MKLIDILSAALSAARRLGPYALLEVLLPGGTLLAVLLYLYRRRMRASAGSREQTLVSAACSS